ncbi:MAG: hypothetical protein PHV51_11380, partial [Methanosarcinaceae archaeon]|nr:hypothetical protein [Methanosarcinaceae archaeon]
GLLAVDRQDEGEVLRVIDSLRELGISLTRKSRSVFPSTGSGPAAEAESEAEKVIAEIEELGEAAARQAIPVGVLNTAVSLGKLGKEAARVGNTSLLLRAALALGDTGKNAIRVNMKVPVRVTASALKEVGKEAARQKMEDAVIASQLLLKDLGSFVTPGEGCFEGLSSCVVAPLREIGKASAREGLEVATTSAEVLLEEAQLRLNTEFFKRGKTNPGERKYYEESCNALTCLGEIGNLSARRQLKKAAFQAYLSLDIIKRDAKAKYLGNTTLNADAQLESLDKIKIHPGAQAGGREEIEKLHTEISARMDMF